MPIARRQLLAASAIASLGFPAISVAQTRQLRLGILTPNGHPWNVAALKVADMLNQETKGRLTLTATLKNRAPFAQQFPLLELTLTDTADKAIVRKVLGPEAYPPRGTAIANGMAPNADVSVALALDAGDLPASGYRLYIFYP